MEGSTLLEQTEGWLQSNHQQINSLIHLLTGAIGNRLSIADVGMMMLMVRSWEYDFWQVEIGLVSGSFWQFCLMLFE